MKRYHTGINALYLPSWCGGDNREENQEESTISSTSVSFDMHSQPYLLVPYRDNLPKRKGWGHPLFKGLVEAKENWLDTIGRANHQLKSFHPLQFKRMHEVYPKGFTWEQLEQHPALILIPYQVFLYS